SWVGKKLVSGKLGCQRALSRREGRESSWRRGWLAIQADEHLIQPGINGVVVFERSSLDTNPLEPVQPGENDIRLIERLHQLPFVCGERANRVVGMTRELPCFTVVPHE